MHVVKQLPFLKRLCLIWLPSRFSGCNIFVVKQSGSVRRLISVIPALKNWSMRMPGSLRCEQLNKPRGSLGFRVRQPKGSSQWVGSAGINTCCYDPTSWVLALENKLDVVSYNSNTSTVGSQEVKTGILGSSSWRTGHSNRHKRCPVPTRWAGRINPWKITSDFHKRCPWD